MTYGIPEKYKTYSSPPPNLEHIVRLQMHKQQKSDYSLFQSFSGFVNLTRNTNFEADFCCLQRFILKQINDLQNLSKSTGFWHELPADKRQEIYSAKVTGTSCRYVGQSRCYWNNQQNREGYISLQFFQYK